MINTTLFECNMQLYAVEFEVNGTSIGFVNLWKVEISVHKTTPHSSYQEDVSVSLSIPTMFRLTRTSDGAIEAAFREKYIPRATFQRIEKSQHHAD